MSAAPTFARLHIMPQLPRFMARHPDLDVEVILDDRTVDLVAEGIDLALRMGALPDPSAVARKLATGGRSVLATPAYLARAGAPRDPTDLAEHEAVIHCQLPNIWSFTGLGGEVSISLRGRLRVSASEGLRAAVLADMGLTVASDWMFAPELADGRVRKLLGAWTLPSIELWAVFPTGRMASAKARHFASFVETVMAGGC